MPMTESFWNECRSAWRSVRRSPGFSLVAILTLALAIGATTVLFTIVESVLLRPLPFPDAQRLAMIRPTSGARLSPAYLYEWRTQSATFHDIAGWHDVRVNLTSKEEPIEVLADRATTNFFAVLGTPAIQGRTFTTAPDLSQVQPEVVLSYGLWQRRYGGDPGAIGQPITLDGNTLTIVGVMPEGFAIRTTELAQSRAEIWVPLSLAPGDRTGMGGTLNLVGRLTPATTIGQAQSELSLIARRIEAEFPSYSRDWGVQALPLLDATVSDVRLTLLVLFGAVGILLLIACANVANLMMTRGVARQPELAIQLALGATKARLVRQLLSQSLLLASVGGVLGTLLAVWGTEAFVSAIPPGLDLPRAAAIRADMGVLAFAALVTIGTALLFGVGPAVRSAGLAGSSLRQTARGSSPMPTQHRTGGAVIVAEVTLAVMVLAAAGLLARSFRELSQVQPGFEAAHVLTMRTTLSTLRYDTDDRIRAFTTELLDRLEAVPGISHAGFANYLPMSRFGAASRFEIEGQPDTGLEDQKFSWVSVAGGRYFEAMGIPLRRGRLPGDADTERTEPVFVIDEALARRYWPDADPIGTRLVWDLGDDERLAGEIIGVVGSVRWGGLAVDAPAGAYWWFPQAPRRELAIAVRTTGSPASMAGLVSAQVRAIDAGQPLAAVRPLEAFVTDDLARPRFTMLLLGGFAAAALLLAVIGLYGVIAFSAAQRTREIGVRVALGAQHRDILRLVMRRGIVLVGIGLAIGFAAALASGRVVANLLYGVTPGDPATLLGVTLFLAAVAVVAIYVPARRAVRADPLAALRT
jgi:putative ABC transport system permease protein